MGRKKKIQYGAKAENTYGGHAENTSGQHDVTMGAASGGRHHVVIHHVSR